jgi:3-hydroxyisobutyrate dehydrogenase-like beta-hydroxyacid dehydrogenase
LGPVLSTLASSVVHTGGVGTATRLMALHRALLAGGYPATAQSLVREHSVRARRAA